MRFAVPKQRRYRYGEDFLFFEHGLCVVFVKRVVRERGRGLGGAESRKSKEKVLVLEMTLEITYSFLRYLYPGNMQYPRPTVWAEKISKI